MSGGIYWIASYPRSGNTWVRAFVAVLTRGAIHDLAPALVPARGAPTPDTVQRNEEAQVRLAQSAAGVAFCKTHALRATVNGVSTISPKATRGATYLIRDPRDVAVSYAAFLGTSLDVAIARLNDPNFGHLEPMGTWSMNAESWMRRPDTIVVRFESLKADPVRWFSRLAQHARLDVSDMAIAEAIAASSFEKMKELDQASPIHRDKTTVRSGVSGGWKSVLTRAQARDIERAHKKVMRRFGYL